LGKRDLKCDHYRGAAASPIPHLDTLIVHFDGHDLQYIVCLSQQTGKTIWKKERAYDFKTDNGDRKKAYCTPSVIEHKGRLELISPGAVATESRNPQNGDLYWTVRTGGNEFLFTANSQRRNCLCILRHGFDVRH
jgi:hypothetical protein